MCDDASDVFGLPPPEVVSCVCSYRGLGVSACLIAACSGNNGPYPFGPRPQPVVSPVLVPGTVAQYTGTETVVRTVPSPTASNPGSTAAYTFAATRSVQRSASGFFYDMEFT